MKMKRTILLTLLALMGAGVVQAQHYIGLRGGVGVGYGRFEPASYYTMKWVPGVWSGGLQWKYYGPVRYVGAIGAEVEFLQRAYQQQAGLDSPDYVRRVYNTVNVPLIWHIHLNLAHNRLRVFLNAGIWASYNIGARQWTRVDGVVTEEPYKMLLVRDNPFNYGLLGGLGANVIFGRWELLVEARYYFSYGDILRNSDVYASNPTRSPLDNIMLSLGFFYRLGDKPHEPELPAWYLRRQARKQAERLQEAGASAETTNESSK